jgi:hypothetical protein
MNLRQATRSWKSFNGSFLSPRYLVRCAILIALLFGIVTVAGLRDYTSILSGTVGSLRLGWQISALLGFAYIFAYLGFVLLAPILLIAVGLLWSWQRILLRTSADTQSTKVPTSIVGEMLQPGKRSNKISS